MKLEADQSYLSLPNGWTMGDDNKELLLLETSYLWSPLRRDLRWPLSLLRFGDSM